MSLFKDPRRKPFWQWWHGFTMHAANRRDWMSWGFGIGCYPTLPKGISFSLSLLWWRWHVSCIWDQWRDE